jgi:hypothetical protein
MFTIKLYSGDGFRQRILSAESFTVLRGAASNAGFEAEITLHQKNQNDDVRYDIKPATELPPDYVGPQIFQKAIIENAAGRTTEIISYDKF